MKNYIRFIPLILLAVLIITDTLLSISPLKINMKPLTIVLGSFFIFYWLMLDAQFRNYHVSTALKIFTLLLAIVAVPYYLIKTRGKKAWLSFLYIFLGFLSTVIISLIIALLFGWN